MRYLWSTPLLLLLFLGPLAAAPAKRSAGKKSSISSVRDKEKFNRKPNVYSSKKNRPLVVKKPHWWQRR